MPGWRVSPSARAAAQIRPRRRIPRLQPGRGAHAQQAVQSGEYSDYQGYAKLVNERPATTLAICSRLRRVKTRSTLLMLNRQADVSTL
ncbi:hypothetical protein ACNKHV_20255 [Shigella flexneri]